MSVYALDTNTISFFIKENKCVVDNFFRVLEDGHSLIIPPIAYYEVRRGLLKKDARKQTEAFNDFCKTIPIGEITIAMLDEAAEIHAGNRGLKRTIGDADTLIAAFCIVSNYTLVTNNTKHFTDIEGISLVDWTQEQL
ncbi:MAG: PIN domain-containing protein [Defluviitaleaceae bacterium]|nr:PIN domain-containing protein [Defluviitaleaceae bacterium]